MVYFAITCIVHCVWVPLLFVRYNASAIRQLWDYGLDLNWKRKGKEDKASQSRLIDASRAKLNQLRQEDIDGSRVKLSQLRLLSEGKDKDSTHHRCASGCVAA
jgi:hypothetical protein